MHCSRIYFVFFSSKETTLFAMVLSPPSSKCSNDVFVDNKSGGGVIKFIVKKAESNSFNNSKMTHLMIRIHGRMGPNTYYYAHVSCWLILPKWLVVKLHSPTHTRGCGRTQINKQTNQISWNRLLLLLHYLGSLTFHFAIVSAAAAAFFFAFILQFQ